MTQKLGFTICSLCLLLLEAWHFRYPWNQVINMNCIFHLKSKHEREPLCADILPSAWKKELSIKVMIATLPNSMGASPQARGHAGNTSCFSPVCKSEREKKIVLSLQLSNSARHTKVYCQCPVWREIALVSQGFSENQNGPRAYCTWHTFPSLIVSGLMCKTP